MANFQAEATITAAVEKVWSALADETRRTEWVPGVEGVARVTGGERGPDYRFRETRTLNRRTESYEVKIAELVPMSLLSLSVQVPGGEYRYAYSIHPVATGTAIRLVVESRPRNWLGRALLPLGMRWIAKAESDQLKRLQRLFPPGSPAPRQDGLPHRPGFRPAPR